MNPTGHLHSSHAINDRPVALTKWRMTTGDPAVAETLADLFDGDDPKAWETKGEDNLETFTEASSVDVILDGPQDIQLEMDSQVHAPPVGVAFRLVRRPGLGVFTFRTTSRSFLADLRAGNTKSTIARLSADGGGAAIAASLSLENVSFVAANGPRAGHTITYVRPVLSVKGIAG